MYLSCFKTADLHFGVGPACTVAVRSLDLTEVNCFATLRSFNKLSATGKMKPHFNKIIITLLLQICLYLFFFTWKPPRTVSLKVYALFNICTMRHVHSWKLPSLIPSLHSLPPEQLLWGVWGQNKGPTLKVSVELREFLSWDSDLGWKQCKERLSNVLHIDEVLTV